MNEREISTLIWHNGNIVPKEKIFPTFDFNLFFYSNLVEYFFTTGTEILFFNETFSRFQSLLKLYNFDSVLFSDESGETLRKETKRLLIRNKIYKTARCYYLISFSPETNSINEYIFLVPDPQLFGLDKIIKNAGVSNQLLKPSGIVMTFPTMVHEFRKIIKTEMDVENVDDCIILNQDQNIVESYLGNIFLIEPGKVYTPSLSSGCTPLLMRDIILKTFRQLNFEVFEKSDLHIENLFNANEIIVAGETGIYSLKGIEYKRYFDNVRKVLISKITEAGAN